MEAVVAKVGAWIGAIFPAALGSALAIFMNKTAELSRGEKVCSFLFGANIAHILGGAAIEFWVLEPMSFIASAIQFTVGLMGMAVLAQVMLLIPKIVDTLRRKYIGE